MNNKSKNLLDSIEMLSQPLLDSKGRINPACVNEIEQTILSMEKTYDRLSNDTEWNTPRCTSRSEIVGHFAMWACRQSPYGCPEGLENICKYLNECLKGKYKWQFGLADLSLCSINKSLYDILYDKNIDQFDKWNEPKIKTKNNSNIKFTPRFDEEENPDYEFIDLDALLHNVCISIRDERRKNDEFDRKFEEEQKIVNYENECSNNI